MAGIPSAPAGPLVLVADDEPDVRAFVCDILAEAGMRTLAATDGEEVVALALAHRPDLVVMDIVMPGVDGYTTLTRLRGHPATRDIPVVILTGQDDAVFRSLSVGVGAAAHVTKPFSLDQLVRTVRRALDPGPA